MPRRGMRRPGAIADLVWHAWVESARRLDIAHRLRVPDLGSEVAAQSQLFEHSEIVHGIAGLPRTHVVVLLAIEPGQERGPRRLRCLHEIDTVVRKALGVEPIETIEKDLLLPARVRIGDHDRHELTDSGRLRAGRSGSRQNRICYLVEQFDLCRREHFANRPAAGNGTTG